MKSTILHVMFCLALTSVTIAQVADVSKLKVAEIEQSVVKIVVIDSLNRPISIGTGFFVEKNNLIATAAHVYLEAGKTMVDHSGGQLLTWKNFSDGRKLIFPIQLVATDYGHDVAILRFDPSLVKQQVPSFEIRPLQVDDHEPELGDSVGFLGFFASDDFPLWSRTVVAGFTPSPRQIVLDLPANPGQSGAPVFSLTSGKVVGILSSFVPVILVPGGLPTHSGLSRSVEVEHLKRLIESADVR